MIGKLVAMIEIVVFVDVCAGKLTSATSCSGRYGLLRYVATPQVELRNLPAQNMIAQGVFVF